MAATSADRGDDAFDSPVPQTIVLLRPGVCKQSQGKIKREPKLPSQLSAYEKESGGNNFLHRPASCMKAEKAKTSEQHGVGLGFGNRRSWNIQRQQVLNRGWGRAPQSFEFTDASKVPSAPHLLSDALDLLALIKDNRTPQDQPANRRETGEVESEGEAKPVDVTH